jgi:transcriptional regulator with XRE-family HTH domain
LVGQNIRIGRLQRGLSQIDLGARIGVAFQQIQKYENGSNRVGASRLQQIADVLRMSVPALFDGAPTAHRPREQFARLLLTKPHALRLLLAFDQIKDEATRLAVLQVIESIPRTAMRRRPRNRNGG